MARILAAALLYLALGLHEWTNGWIQVTLFLSLFALQFAILLTAPHTLSLRTIVWSAVLFRLLLLPAGWHDGEWQRFLLYDSDVWRYLWDGHVSASGINPYRFAPNDPVLDALAVNEPWSAVRDFVNYGDLPTIYPPAAQAVFLLVPGNALAMKAAVVGFDLLTLYFLICTLRVLVRPVQECIWWAWNPLVIKAFAGSAHIDSLTCAALAGLFYALARVRETPAASAFLVAVLSKWGPLVLAPLLLLQNSRWRRIPWLGALALLGAAPLAIPHLFAGVGAFAEFWQFNALPYQIFVLITGSSVVARLCCAGCVLAVSLWAARKTTPGLESLCRFAGYSLGALILFSPAVMPWYVTWLLPGAIIARERAWVAFSGFVFLAFFVMVDGRERWYILAVEYIAFAALFVGRQRTAREKQHTKLDSGPRRLES